jgi:hypothetical protein
MAYLRVKFQEPSTPPSGGYIFKYKLTSSSVWTTAPSSPISSVGADQFITAEVDSVSAGDYEVLIQSDCGGGIFGDEQIFSCTAIICASHNVENTDGSDTFYFTYYRCSDGAVITVYLPAGITSDDFCHNETLGAIFVEDPALVVSAAAICPTPETG